MVYDHFNLLKCCINNVKSTKTMAFLSTPLILSKITTATLGRILIMYQAVTASLQTSEGVVFCSS